MNVDRENNDCLVIMPIDDSNCGYNEGHFKTIYDSFIKPSVLHAGLNPIRADDFFFDANNYFNVVKRIMEASVVLFDLSSRNHRIITALRIRRAFHFKALIIIKDDRTPENEDMRMAKYIEYPQNIKSHNLSLMQLMLTKMILDTIKAMREKENLN